MYNRIQKTVERLRSKSEMRYHFVCKYLLLITIFFLLAACKSAPPQNEPPGIEPPDEPPQEIPAEPEPEFEVLEPDFIITSITILQADLINTRFKLSLSINNPNTFPITLSSFRYELYGDGNFWADGEVKNLAVIPAQSSLETNFEAEMNFINMKRKLLDDIIALRQVRYRVAGNVKVETGMASVPVFNMKFDLSGNSPVKK
jgi:LEA14-like dessication related protein